MRRGWSTAFAGWLAGVAAFQAALALGAPWGAAAWGGTHRGVLPSGLRAASAASALAWAGASTVVGGAVGGPATRRNVLRGTTALVGVGVLLNAASRSRVERAIWVPTTVAGAVLGLGALRQTSPG